MSSSTKTDNAHLQTKLDLRRHFLQKYHGGNDPANVFDCCQGGGAIWAELKREFKIAGYWGVDLKPKPGRLRIDSARVLAQPGMLQTVYDIDTYGSPWKHWAALLPNVTHSITVFLTIGATLFRGSVDAMSLRAMGLRFNKLKLPESFCGKLSALSVPYCLSLASTHGLAIADLVEAFPSANARYLGLRLVKTDPVQA